MLQTADGQPLANARINVSQQAPGWTGQQIGTVSTDSKGGFNYKLAGGPTRTIRFAFAGTKTLGGATGTANVDVRGRATIMAGKTARVGTPWGLAGRVLGGYIPPGGLNIQLEYTTLGSLNGWPPFHRVIKTRPTGSWSVTITWPAGSAGFTYRIRAHVYSQSGWPYDYAISPIVQRKVTP
jgi:hypothetical protein